MYTCVYVSCFYIFITFYKDIIRISIFLKMITREKTEANWPCFLILFILFFYNDNDNDTDNDTNNDTNNDMIMIL